MERLILGFSGFFAMFLGMFFEGRVGNQTEAVTQYGKAEIQGSD